MRRKLGLINISKISVISIIIAVVNLISFNIPDSRDSNKGLVPYKTGRYLFIKPSSADDINNDINLTNFLQNLTFKLHYRELFYNNFFMKNSSGRINKIPVLNILFHIQRNHLHIARLKAG